MKTPYEYAVIRVVPRVDREEFVNAGVILYQPQSRFLKARVALPEERLAALFPTADVAQIRTHLAAIQQVCDGEPSAGSIGRMKASERFRWLTAPRSTMIQTSPVRMGVSAEPQKELEDLAYDFVA